MSVNREKHKGKRQKVTEDKNPMSDNLKSKTAKGKAPKKGC